MAIGGDFTLRLLKDAGVHANMRALDLGCGTGDVSLIAADLVGPDGAIIGIDNNAGALAAARDRVRELGHQNIDFIECDLRNLSDDMGIFDAIIGRRVLMYQADVVRAIRGLLPRLRPGGLAAFHEHDSTMVPFSSKAMPLHHRVQGWMKKTIEREGADTQMGFNLHEALTSAGLSVEHVRAEAIVQTPTQRYPAVSIIRAMLARIVEQGVASENEIDIETLDQRLDMERRNTGATYIGDMMFGVWARKPA